MDGHRFDDLVRAVSSRGADRRHAIRLALGGALGLAGWLDSGPAAAHDAQRRCRKIENRRKRQKCLKQAKRHNAGHNLVEPPPECESPTTCPAPSQACARAACTGGKCGVEPRGTGFVCRSTAGPCDVEERCDGSSLDCPEDQFRPRSDVCQPGACVGPSTARPAVFCSGTSAECPTPNVQDCGLVRCNTATGACYPNCDGDHHCVDAAWCNGGGCAPRRANGQSCTAPNQCHSRQCVSGVCCNSSCIAPPNASRSCPGGTCAFTCNAGFGNCNGNWSDGCETSLTSNSQHCGACNSPCGGSCNSGGETGVRICNEAGQCVCSAGALP